MNAVVNDPVDDLRRQVFLSVYGSAEQRSRRRIATSLLVAKHVLRGMLFSWPLYLLLAAAFFLPGWQAALLLALVLPAIGVSFWILGKGVREDYHSRIAGRLHDKGYLRHVLY
jgi:hypothetical protein